MHALKPLDRGSVGKKKNIILSDSFISSLILREKMASNEDEVLEDGLQSDSLVNVRTPSPSILNSPMQVQEEISEEEEEEDGVNVTIRPLRPSPNQVDKSGGLSDNMTQERQDGEKTVPEKQERRGLCGAARRRLQKLMKDGMDYTTARERAKLPLASTPKRLRKADLDRTNSSEEKPVTKKIRDGAAGGGEAANRVAKSPPRQVNSNKVIITKNLTTVIRDAGENAGGSKAHGSTHDPKMMHGQGRSTLPAPTYSDIASRVRLGILPKNYPAVELSTNQQEVVQEALLLKVVQQRREQFKPKFACCRFKPGYLVLTCQENDTAKWVKDKFSSLNLWEGADLVVVDEDKIPRPDVLIAFFPWSAKYSNDMILSLIESQNENLHTDAWRILHRHVKSDHVELALTVDDSSLRKFGERKFVLNYRYGQILIKKKRPVQSNTGEQGNPSDVTDDMVVDSSPIQEDLVVPEISELRKDLKKSNPQSTAEKASQEVNSENSSAIAGGSGSKIQGQSHAYGKQEPLSNIPSNKSSVQSRLQQRE